VRHAPDPDEQHVGTDDRDEHDGDEHDVPEEHLAEVHEVEEGPDARCVEGVLAVGRDPLGVEVLLGEVAGEALDDRRDEGDDAGHPGGGAAPSPCRHPELAPEVDDHEGHEELDAPQVHAVEEVPDGVGVPPVDPAEGDGEAGADGDGERGDGRDAEDVDPRCDVGRLTVGEKLSRRKEPERGVAHTSRPHTARVVVDGARAVGRDPLCLRRVLVAGCLRGGGRPCAVRATVPLRERQE
jgi:hypothetical protein